MNKRQKKKEMNLKEYEELKQRLLAKRHKGNCITSREDGFNEGILCAVSMIREVYRRQFNKDNRV